MSGPVPPWSLICYEPGCRLETTELVSGGTKVSMVRYKNSAFKHGYTRWDIERVLDSPISVSELRGSQLVISKVGFASNMDLIEVLYEYDHRGDTVVFHADICRRY